MMSLPPSYVSSLYVLFSSKLGIARLDYPLTMHLNFKCIFSPSIGRFHHLIQCLIALVEVLSERRFPPRLATYFLQNFEGTDLCSYTHEPTSKVRSHDAAHTIASLGYVLFSARPLPYGVGSLRKRKSLG